LSLKPFRFPAIGAGYFCRLRTSRDNWQEKNMIIGSVNGYVYAMRITIAASVLIIYISVYTNRYPAIQDKHTGIIGFKGYSENFSGQYKHRLLIVIGVSALVLTFLQERCIFKRQRNKVSRKLILYIAMSLDGYILSSLLI
jgi:nitric oxide reductase large subunit